MWLLNFPHHHQTNEFLEHTFVESLDIHSMLFLDLVAGEQAQERENDEFLVLLIRLTASNL